MARFMLIIALLIMVPACSSEAPSTASETTPVNAAASSEVETSEATTSVGGDEPIPPESCTEESVRSTVESFVDAYANGEPDLTDRFFADADRFQWYSEPPDRLREAAFDRATLDLYLLQRHVDGDRLQLVEMNYNGYRTFDRTGHFDFIVRRDNVEDVIGKGSIDCLSGAIMVWSLGPNPGPTGT